MKNLNKNVSFESENIILKAVYNKKQILDIIENLLVNSLETYSGYWAKQVKKENDIPVLSEHCYIKRIVTIAEREASSKKGIVQVTLTEDKLLEGLAVMKQNYPRHFNDALTENDDAITADVFLQCCVLKEVIYG